MSATAPPYGPPQPPAHRRRPGGVVGPLILIFVGGVFLLQNTGYLPPTFWVNLWRLWPLLLVLGGVELLLAHRVPWPALAGLVALVLVIGAVATNAAMPASSRVPPATRTVQSELGAATQAAVTVNISAGHLDVGPLLQPPVGALARMTYDGPTELLPQPRYTSGVGGTGQLDYIVGGNGVRFMPFVGAGSDTPSLRLDLNPGVPITSLTVQTGATDARLDLSGLLINNVDMSIGAASTWLRLPQITGTSTVHLSGGAANIALEVPQGVAATIRHRGGLSTVTVDTTRFPQLSDGLYRSPEYDTATSRVNVSLETGVTSIQVH